MPTLTPERPTEAGPTIEGVASVEDVVMMSRENLSNPEDVVPRSEDEAGEIEVNAGVAGDFTGTQNREIFDLAREARVNVRSSTVASALGKFATWARDRVAADGIIGKALSPLESSLSKNERIMEKTHAGLLGIGLQQAESWWERQQELIANGEREELTGEEIEAHAKLIAYSEIAKYSELSARASADPDILPRGEAHDQDNALKGGLGRSWSRITADVVLGKEKTLNPDRSWYQKLGSSVLKSARTGSFVVGTKMALVMTPTLWGGEGVERFADIVPSSPLEVALQGALALGAVGWLKAQQLKGGMSSEAVFKGVEDTETLLDRPSAVEGAVETMSQAQEGTRTREGRYDEFGFMEEPLVDEDGNNIEGEERNIIISRNAIGKALTAGLSVMRDRNEEEIQARLDRSKVKTKVAVYAGIGALGGLLFSNISGYVSEKISGFSLDGGGAQSAAGIETPNIHSGTVSELGEGYSLGEVRGSDVDINTPQGQETINLNAADAQGDAFNRGDGQLSSQEIAAQLERAGADIPELAYDVHGDVIDGVEVPSDAVEAGGNENVQTAFTEMASSEASVEGADLNVDANTEIAAGEMLLSPDGGGQMNGFEVGRGVGLDNSLETLVNDIVNPNHQDLDASVFGFNADQAVELQRQLFAIGGTEIFTGDPAAAGNLEVKPGAIINEDMRGEFDQVFSNYREKIIQYGIAA